jgi:hypothetical protein
MRNTGDDAPPVRSVYTSCARGLTTVGETKLVLFLFGPRAGHKAATLLRTVSLVPPPNRLEFQTTLY